MIDAHTLARMRETDFPAYKRERDRQDRREALLRALELEQLLGEGIVGRDPEAERAAVLRQAPVDLKALGVDLPSTRWARACEELHRLEALELALADVAGRDAAVLMLALSVWEGRGRPGYAAGLVDVAEAELQLGDTRAAIARERRRLEACARGGRWP